MRLIKGLKKREFKDKIETFLKGLKNLSFFSLVVPCIFEWWFNNVVHQKLWCRYEMTLKLMCLYMGNLYQLMLILYRIMYSILEYGKGTQNCV